MAKTVRKTPNRSRAKKSITASNVHQEAEKNSRVPRRFFVIAVVIMIALTWGLMSYMLSGKSIGIAATPSPTVKAKRKLPANWKLIEKPAGNVIMQATKKSQSEYTPTVFMARMEVSVDDLKNPKVHIDRIIQGAQSTIPTLTITKNEESKKNMYYVRTIEGNYTEGTRKIGIVQYILVDEKNFFMTAGSFLSRDTDSQKEISEIFAYLSETALAR